eukprot:GHVQ01011492.1.p1 GENE.GHVQ01011492.1~~GHVQ01011492.1.p1  ORF type:complete len:118 (+),score=4.13 GHVQ01011492.1:147-500(+)
MRSVFNVVSEEDTLPRLTCSDYLEMVPKRFGNKVELSHRHCTMVHRLGNLFSLNGQCLGNVNSNIVLSRGGSAKDSHRQALCLLCCICTLLICATQGGLPTTRQPRGASYKIQRANV